MRYVVIGASAAGISGIRTIRSHCKDAEILLISIDTAIYSRCILHHYIHGNRSLAQLDFTEENFIEKNKVEWIKGTAVVKVKPDVKEVMLDDGRCISYDKLLIASGANTFYPPVKNLQGTRNVIGFRNLTDCELIKKQAAESGHIVIMGAGLVGIDALTGLLDYGKDLTLIEFKKHMLSMQLDERAAKAYQDAFEKKGVKQLYGTQVEEVVPGDNQEVKALVLSNGETLPCDLLIVAPGVRPNISFLNGSGVECDSYGLVFDEKGQTNVPDIYGAGDVSGHNPIWPSAVKEGMIAASNMCGIPLHMTDFFASKSTMNFLGITTMSLGITEPLDNSYKVELESDEKGNYKKIIHKAGIIYGAIIQGDLSYVGILTQLIKEKIDVTRVKKPLFEVDYSDFYNIDSNYEFHYK